MIVPGREKCPLAGRHFQEEIAEGSFGAGMPKQAFVRKKHWSMAKSGSKYLRRPALKENERCRSFCITKVVPRYIRPSHEMCEGRSFFYFYQAYQHR